MRVEGYIGKKGTTDTEGTRYCGEFPSDGIGCTCSCVEEANRDQCGGEGGHAGAQGHGGEGHERAWGGEVDMWSGQEEGG